MAGLADGLKASFMATDLVDVGEEKIEHVVEEKGK